MIDKKFNNIAVTIDDRLLARRLMSQGDMYAWSQDQWSLWWRDGLEILLSDNEHKTQAFAPLYVPASRIYSISEITRITYPLEELFQKKQGAAARAMFETAVVDALKDFTYTNDSHKVMATLNLINDLPFSRDEEILTSLIEKERGGVISLDETVINSMVHVFTRQINGKHNQDISDFLGSNLNTANFIELSVYCLKVYDDPFDCIKAIIERWDYSAETDEDILEYFEEDFAKKFGAKKLSSIQSYAADLQKQKKILEVPEGPKPL